MNVYFEVSPWNKTHTAVTNVRTNRIISSFLHDVYDAFTAVCLLFLVKLRWPKTKSFCITRHCKVGVYVPFMPCRGFGFSYPAIFSLLFIKQLE